MFDEKKSTANLDMLDRFGHKTKVSKDKQKGVKKMSEMLGKLQQQQQMYNIQLKQAESNYQQLTGALHVLNDLINVEQARLDKEKADAQLQADSNLVPSEPEGESNGEAVSQEQK